MKLLPSIFLAALASIAGCGGCDACGTSKSGDAPITTTSPQATVAPIDDTPDAAPSRGLDAGRDAASAEAGPAVVPLAVSAPPRPRNAPMPMGDYQNCGVYDGPLCTKECKNGNCRQECDGTDCVLACTGGYCSQLCGASATCRLTCKGGHCVQVCTSPGCLKDCAGGSCE